MGNAIEAGIYRGHMGFRVSVNQELLSWCTHNQDLGAPFFMETNIYIYIHMYMYICMYTIMHRLVLYVHVHMLIHLHIYIYLYIYICKMWCGNL